MPGNNLSSYLNPTNRFSEFLQTPNASNIVPKSSFSSAFKDFNLAQEAPSYANIAGDATALGNLNISDSPSFLDTAGAKFDNLKGSLGNLGSNFGSKFSDLLGTTTDKGFQPGALLSGGKLALGAFNAYNASKQTGLLEDQLAQNQQNFSDQFKVQKDITLGDLRDRNTARRAANPNQGLSDAEFNKRYSALINA